MYNHSKRGDHMRLSQVSQTKQALGGEVSLNLVTSAPTSGVERLFAELWQQVYQFERQFSRFLPMSELSIFNRSAGLKTYVTPAFKDLLSAAKTMGLQTGGLYNPFVLPAVQRAGYIRSAAAGYEADAQDDYSGNSVVSVEHLEIGDDWVSIPYGTALDMGGCGKGYLADRLAQSLQNQAVKGYWLSLGGDITAAGHDENGDPITLNIQDADNLSSVSDWVIHCPAAPSAVATSGTFRRRGQAGKNWHHIIDPKTGKPADTDIRLATVCSHKAITADVLASCAVILGLQKAPSFLRTHGSTAFLLQGSGAQRQFGQTIKQGRPAVVRGSYHDF